MVVNVEARHDMLENLDAGVAPSRAWNAQGTSTRAQRTTVRADRGIRHSF